MRSFWNRATDSDIIRFVIGYECAVEKIIFESKTKLDLFLFQVTSNYFLYDCHRFNVIAVEKDDVRSEKNRTTTSRKYYESEDISDAICAYKFMFGSAVELLNSGSSTF